MFWFPSVSHSNSHCATWQLFHMFVGCLVNSVGEGSFEQTWKEMNHQTVLFKVSRSSCIKCLVIQQWAVHKTTNKMIWRYNIKHRWLIHQTTLRTQPPTATAPIPPSHLKYYKYSNIAIKLVVQAVLLWHNQAKCDWKKNSQLWVVAEILPSNPTVIKTTLVWNNQSQCRVRASYWLAVVYV